MEIIDGLTKITIQMSEHFPQPKSPGGRVKVV